MQSFNQIYGVKDFLLKCSNLEGLDNNLPPFYKACLNAWCKLAAKRRVLDKDTVLEQYLFGSIHISSRKQSIFYPIWSKQKINKIKDIWDVQNNTFKPLKEIKSILKENRHTAAEYAKIKKLIPTSWLNVLRESINLDISNCLIHNRQLIIDHRKIKINGKEINFSKLKDKDIYQAFLYPAKAPNCVAKWNSVFTQELTHKEIFTNLMEVKDSCSNKVFNIQYKIIHRAIFSETRLKLMNMSDGLCTLCNVHDETIVHIFLKCPKICMIWIKVQQLIFKIFNLDVEIDENTLMFGFKYDKKNIRLAVNWIIFSTNCILWKNRNSVKYGKEPSKSVTSIFNELLKCVKYEISYIKQKGIGKSIQEKVKTIINTDFK